MLRENTWEIVYDEEIKDKYEKYLGLVEKSCINVIESEFF